MSSTQYNLILLIKKLSLTFIIIVNVQACDKLFINSIPKSGTHLVINCIRQMLHIPIPFHYDLNEGLKKNSKAFFTHNIWTKSNEEAIKSHKAKGIYIYRDPRDVLLSTANWVLERQQHAKFHNLSLEARIILLMSDYTSYYPFYQEKYSIKDIYNFFSPWKNNPQIYTTSYERLVGPLGRGSSEEQLTELNKIAKHLNLSFTNEELKKIGSEIYGKEWTFRKGQIGEGKKYLNENPELKKLFNNVAGDLLIELGYEKDLNW